MLMDISFFSLLSFYLISRFSVCARCIVLKQYGNQLCSSRERVGCGRFKYEQST